MHYSLNLRQVTYALSEALDYVGIDDTMHGKRVAYVAAEIARTMGWDDIDGILISGMLHDCGVSSTEVHSHLVSELDWEDANLHCQRGYSLLKKVPLFASHAPKVLYHHTHWNLFSLAVDETVRERANLLFLADRIDALRSQIGSQTPQQKASLKQTLSMYAGSMFNPSLLEAFDAVSLSDSFWFYLENEALEQYFSEWIDGGEEEIFDFDTLRKIAMMFARIVDAKSTFTSVHTFGVAALARLLSQLHGQEKRVQESIELAAFFHDLGKLRVADAILHKNAPLTEEERLQMNRHGFDSHLILHKIKGFKEIAKIASMHHETLDGQGYPYHLSADQIPIESRILSVADIFQALVQNRPYRVGMNGSQALSVLNTLVEQGKIDGTVVGLVAAHLDQCYDYAMRPNPLFHENE